VREQKCAQCGLPAGLLLKTADVARRLSCTQRTVQNLVGRGDLDGIKIGKNLRVKHGSLHRFLAEREAEADVVGPRSFQL